MCELQTTILMGSLSAVLVFLAAIATWIAACTSHSFNIFSKRREKFRLYLEFMMEYRTPRMHAAVRDLCRFLRRFGDGGKKTTLQQIYEKRRDKEEGHERANIPPQESLAYLETTLHYRRRLVSQFYHSLYEALRNDLVVQDDVFGCWDPGTLRKIIGKILLELHQDDDKRLEDLLKMAETWEKSNPRASA